jgi:hypothetical protein
MTVPIMITPLSTDKNNPTTSSNSLRPQIAWEEIVGQTQYESEIYDANDSLIYSTGIVDSTMFSYYNVPLGVLVYGEVFGVRVRVNAGGWTDWTDLHYKMVYVTPPTGLVSNNNTSGACIDLNWNVRTADNLGGYRIYRKLATDSEYTVLNSLVTTNSYSDKIAGSGITYDYKISSIAADGYESILTSSVQDTVTYTGAWIDDTSVKFRVYPIFEYPRRANSRIGTNGQYITQDLGLLPRTGVFTLFYENKSERDALLALLPQNHIFQYRSDDGEAFMGKVIGSISETRLEIPAKFYGELTFEAVEVVG